MKKKILMIIGVIIILLSFTGCSKDDTESVMTTYTSVYPVEYILDNLYGDKMAIYGIYPDGTNYTNYKLTIETWLNPSNYLMMASNIKKGLEEYISEEIEKKEIEKNYEKLKLNLTQIDAELKSIANNSNNNILIVGSDAFKYLEKYGFTVISLEENDNLTDKTLADVKKIFSNKMASYIFLKDNDEESKTVKALKDEYNIQIARINSLYTLSATDRKDKKDYNSIMMDNINSIKLEVNN